MASEDDLRVRFEFWKFITKDIPAAADQMADQVAEAIFKLAYVVVAAVPLAGGIYYLMTHNTSQTRPVYRRGIEQKVAPTRSEYAERISGMAEQATRPGASTHEPYAFMREIRERLKLAHGYERTGLKSRQDEAVSMRAALRGAGIDDLLREYVTKSPQDSLLREYLAGSAKGQLAMNGGEKQAP